MIVLEVPKMFFFGFSLGGYPEGGVKTLTLEEEFVIKEGQTAPFSLLFISCTDTLHFFIFSPLLNQSILDFVFAL